ncbi:immune inhibitor A domain-containing protein [Demetria terragena]|uniref:immune inhibitor A domain-containing protein n=1 Tax=Demetria terragena TaxID=63959 RepID=UPI00036517DA|nr:immune inhibitor A domain-containing protein [Demetria terragena]
MTRRFLALVTASSAVTALSVATIAGSAGAVPDSDGSASPPQANGQHVKKHDYPDPLQDKQRLVRQTAVDNYVKGKIKPKTIGGVRVLEVDDGKQTSAQRAAHGGAKHNGAKKRYVQYEPTETSNIFTVLAEFGTKARAAEGGTPGPVHNKIAKPDKKIDGTATDDNEKYWKKNFNRKHYKNLMFSDTDESMRTFYKAQSLGRHHIQGDVSDWVTVPYNGARYGSNKGGEPEEQERYWAFVGDSLTAWHKAQVKAGKSKAEIKKYLKQFDVWDRYDYDEDGNFNEPDGYIDHFQAIHSGEGEEAGGGTLGDDAIWSHRWSVGTGGGEIGPGANKAGGVQIGDTGMWVRDYTTEPENGGLGVFAHEYAHDLGLPDLYDTSGAGVSNSTGYWTLMSSGSWLGHGKGTTGTTPGYMGAWEKLQLGWSDVKTLQYGHSGKVDLGPADMDDAKKPQAVAVSLPDKSVTTDYNTPKSGEYEWWTGRSDNRNAKLTRSIDLTGKKAASVSSAVWYDIEADYDFLYGQVSTDGGKTWTTIGEPVTGAKKEWSEVSFDLSAYAGKKIDFRFLYQTDSGLNEAGAFLDDITVTIDGAKATDDVESEASDWTSSGFIRMTGSHTEVLTHYYLAEHRRYSGYDTTLQTGPYSRGYASTRPDVVEHYPYQDGLLIWYVNNAYKDNNVAKHPGGGQVIPVDANPKPMKWPDGADTSTTLQSYDSTFGTTKTDAFTLHKNGLAANIKSKPGVKVFDDTNPNAYWYESNQYHSTKVAGTGTKILVKGQTKDGTTVSVQFPKVGEMRKR